MPGSPHPTDYTFGWYLTPTPCTTLQSFFQTSNKNNILYDEKTDKCYLIDGGDFCNIGETTSSFEQSPDPKIQALFKHIAPECWKEPLIAAPAIDIFSLAQVMKTRFSETEITGMDTALF
ncbi:MAG: hypothetical protein Q8R79_05675 [Legionellaceae bacterium]|nr:hypothetical protein [Legionellaceae bacterium]